MAKLYARKSDGTYVPYNPQSVTNIDVVQTTGDSVTAAMSQDAVTKKLATKQGILTPSNGISIEGNVIGVTTITESESQPHTSLWVNPSEDEETDVTYNRSQIDAMIGAKQDALQLTVKDNGNIVLSNIQGQSKEFMPATPSGDPMHWAYVAAGAEYNDTGADITKTAPWADMVDDEADAIVIHKAGYWYLNGLGDIDNAEIRNIYAKSAHVLQASSWEEVFYTEYSCRTYFPFENNYYKGAWKDLNISYAFLASRAKTINVKNIRVGASISAFKTDTLKYIIGIIEMSNSIRASSNEMLLSKNLRCVKVKKLIISILTNSPLLSLKSILYMIQNEVATKAITITLHADAYARAMANADIVAALEAHPNVSLASA